MNGRRAMIGICMLCALLVSAFAAEGASAAGTTAYTCKEMGSGAGFSDAHCKTAAEKGPYQHVAIPVNTTTEGTGSNETTGGVKESLKLKATSAGASITLTAGTATGSGLGTNAEEGGEMFTHGEGSGTFTEVTATGNCKVYTDNNGVKGEEGVVHTEPLKATSKGQGDFGKSEPKEGTVFARFILEGCTNSGINGTYTVTGSIKCAGEGATAKCTHANTTEQNTLKLNGTIKIGIEGTGTAKSRLSGAEPYTTASVTT